MGRAMRMLAAGVGIVLAAIGGLAVLAVLTVAVFVAELF